MPQTTIAVAPTMTSTVTLNMGDRTTMATMHPLIGRVNSHYNTEAPADKTSLTEPHTATVGRM